MKASSLRFLLATAMLLRFGSAPSAAQTAVAATPPPRIDILLWFDTEDYLLPADDDACKRLAGMLTERGIRATFKVVGEKARVLERRGRQDVIDALRRHAIGYHANLHSVHPTPSEYLEDCGFLDGIAEFIRREGSGAEDVRRIFGVPTLVCYGQPGSSWAAQAIAALPAIGVAPGGQPCYVDEGSHVGLNEQPFWYAGALNVYHMGENVTRMELHDPAALGPAESKAAAIAARLAQVGGGLISIYYHPCEWVHEQFWDGVNFAKGRNPPREEWKAPPQLPPEETEAAFQRFAQYLDFLKALPGARFVTAEDLPQIYRDTVRTDGATREELDELARRIVGEDTAIAQSADLQVINDKVFSLADQFGLLAGAVSDFIAGKALSFPRAAPTLLGPDGAPPPSRRENGISWPAFRDSVVDVADFLAREKRIPARVFIGADPVPPIDYLAALAAAYLGFRQTGGAPESLALGSGLKVAPERFVAADTPQLFGGWVIHRAGFRGPKLMEIARWQAWTLKPAVRAE